MKYVTPDEVYITYTFHNAKSLTQPSLRIIYEIPVYWPG